VGSSGVRCRAMHQATLLSRSAPDQGLLWGLLLPSPAPEYWILNLILSSLHPSEAEAEAEAYAYAKAEAKA